MADELASRFGFQRQRQSVAAFVRTHFPDLICQPAPRAKARRRWERARLGELWQHDSFIHQWWPATDKQTLLLTVDDQSRKLWGAVFVPTDTKRLLPIAYAILLPGRASSLHCGRDSQHHL